jgi:signal transduction histidine kinase/DNA-binding response OmpR family regulator
MTIRKKVILLIIGCLIIFSGTLFIFRISHVRQNSLVYQSAVEHQDILVKNAILAKTDQLNQIVTDYTNWDDLIYFIDHYDQKWGVDNIATTINSFKLHSVSVFNPEYKMVYGFGKYPQDVIGNLAEKEEIFNSLDKNKFVHYFRKIPEGILEISAASIHPTLDTTRITQGYGYFFASKLWDQQYLANLSVITGSTISEGLERPQNTGKEEDFAITTTYPIKDFNGRNFTGIIFTKPYKLLGMNQKISDFVMYFLAALLLIILSLFLYILLRWVTRPLRIISDTLQRGDTYQLGSLQKKEDEFSQIAMLIIKFNQQRKQLELENAERKLIQQEAALQSKLLQALAEASNRLLTIDDLDEAIRLSVESIENKAKVDRIFIFKIVFDNEREGLVAERVYDWIRPELKPFVDQAATFNLHDSNRSDSLYSILQQGATIKGNHWEFDDNMKSLLEAQLIKSIIIVPILDPREHTFWGFMGFADCNTERFWGDSEETVLNMLANNIGGAIRRYMSQQELKDAMELARTADRAKSNFLASMSHEIRTPMNGVIGMTSLLLQSDLSKAQREYVETIETSGDSLLNIINEILDFSKIESGHMVLEESPFDLRGCIEDVLDLMAPKIFEKRLEIIYYLDPEIQPYIFGDGFRLRQILVNLIGNAIKFTEKGEILVQVTRVESQEDSVILEFSVKDSGIGIPVEKVDALFKPFSQVDASTTRKYGGSGLGLAISANLVQLMDGKIWVESEIDKGSDFRFTIKTYYTTLPENADHTIDDLRHLSGRSILIVDDNATNRRILQLQCEFWNIDSVAVGSGADALKLIDMNTKFDACILDMQMPVMDGEMLAKEIRMRIDKEHLPLIMLTSIGFNSRTPEVQQLFSYYVQKPVKHSRLAEILFSVFTQTQSMDDVRKDDELELFPVANDYPFKILIAEDNFINQKLIRNLFEVLGYKTDLVANGHEAIDALKHKKYDLIFMDVQMPEMDGYEATHKIRERWGGDGPVIIAMTANAMQGDREKCLVSGMDDYISKPLRLEDLMRVIKYWGEMKLMNASNTILKTG